MFVGSGVLLAILAIAVMALLSNTDAKWVSYCDVEGHWVVKFTDGRECSDQAKSHLDEFGHSAGCKRVDLSISIIDKLFELTVPGNSE